MPRFRPRAQVLKALRAFDEKRERQAVMRNFVLEEEDSDEDVLDDCCKTVEDAVHSRKHLNERGACRKRVFDWDDCLSDESRRFNDEEFLKHFRVSREKLPTSGSLDRRSPIIQKCRKEEEEGCRFSALVGFLMPHGFGRSGC